MDISTEVRRGRHAVWNLHVHLVFVTKYRRGVFTDAILTDCEKIMRDVCEDFGAALREFGGEDDHVHLLVEYPATVQVSRLVNSLKGVTSRHLRRRHAEHVTEYLWGGSLWSRSYYAVSVGGGSVEEVADYIERQRRPG